MHVRFLPRGNPGCNEVIRCMFGENLNAWHRLCCHVVNRYLFFFRTLSASFLCSFSSGAEVELHSCRLRFPPWNPEHASRLAVLSTLLGLPAGSIVTRLRLLDCANGVGSLLLLAFHSRNSDSVPGSIVRATQRPGVALQSTRTQEANTRNSKEGSHPQRLKQPKRTNIDATEQGTSNR
jgi:hypothetical protein